ncbi:DsbA family oxidoreductase [Desertivirga arenae]|uniref:DsbA family oxidoreductase n=1 Tax=Desertivirga arenae TaxID=2810309 RepID=UPI001A96B7C7|nr:DsbA family oxidoreductase [Pedobacter sp. SYSU D00823]
MKVEIWSDVVCPFCYIGKRKFEQALDNFAGKDNVEIIWKSFQLDPTTKSAPGVSVIENLAEKKGISFEHSEKMHENVTQSAAEVGLEYNFDKAIIANTIKAHQLTHFAAKYYLQDAAEEALFKAYFTEGKDIGDIETLVALAEELGLNKEEARKALDNNNYITDVKKDLEEAQQLGVRGVPFFVFNRQFAVSGAQPTEVFADVLAKVAQEESQLKEVITGDSCDVDGSCD